MGAHYKNITKCRVCYSVNITEVLKIKKQFIASTFVKSNLNNLKSKIKVPMTLVLCNSCGLVQLKETVNPELLYENYFYRSSVNSTMKNDLPEVVKDVCSRVELKKGDYVLDIGCNDGFMLSKFPAFLNRVGIEPAKNIEWRHLDKSIKIINDYFPSQELKNNKFKIITTTAMFYDLDDPNTAVQQIKDILVEDGVLCIQVSYLYETIHNLNFYDICHEHLEYYTLRTLSYLLDKNGMEVFDASTNFVNGGSLRVMAAHKDAKRQISRNLQIFLNKEEELQLSKPSTYKKFSEQVEVNTKKIKDYIKNEKGLVIGLGASTKGNVLIQLCALDNKSLPYISERNPLKVGLRTLGTDILLISEEEARNRMPSCIFVIPWNFRKEILEREKEYLIGGGKMLFAMPYPHVIDKDGETKL